MRFFTIIILTSLLVPLAIINSFAATAYEQLNVVGETASTGIYDPSIEYTQDGSTGYMVYTACDNWPLYLHTHLAKTTDQGQTWTFVQRINESIAEIVDVYGTTHTGIWHNETSTLIHDPDDAGKEWKLYWGHHFFKDNGFTLLSLHIHIGIYNSFIGAYTKFDNLFTSVFK